MQGEILFSISFFFSLIHYNYLEGEPSKVGSQRACITSQMLRGMLKAEEKQQK